MNTPTYKEQFDKLTRAYINGEVNPFSPCACFIGNLLNGAREWSVTGECVGNHFGDHVRDCILKEANGLYTEDEINELENSFMNEDNGDFPSLWSSLVIVGKFKDWYEDALFIAFERCLDQLKQIHQSKGEIIDETPVFQKRQLQPA